MAEELLERYRPKSFEEVLGQDELVSTLARRVITTDHSRHIVLHGPEGSGKTTVARLYAQALQCQSPPQLARLVIDVTLVAPLVAV